MLFDLKVSYCHHTKRINNPKKIFYLCSIVIQEQLVASDLGM